MGNKKIKRNQEVNKGKLFDSKPFDDERFDYPIFCFRNIHRDFNLSNCSDEEKKQLIVKLFQLSSMSWIEIQLADRRGPGTEKIKMSSLKIKPPPFITEDVDSLLCVRFGGGLQRLLFYRNRFIAHIIFIDPKGELYNHN